MIFLKVNKLYKIIEALSNGELSRKGRNQEINLKYVGDTCQDSYYGSLMNISLFFSSVINVLKILAKEGTNFEQKFQTKNNIEIDAII